MRIIWWATARIWTSSRPTTRRTKQLHWTLLTENQERPSRLQRTCKVKLRGKPCRKRCWPQPRRKQRRSWRRGAQNSIILQDGWRTLPSPLTLESQHSMHMVKQTSILVWEASIMGITCWPITLMQNVAIIHPFINKSMTRHSKLDLKRQEVCECLKFLWPKPRRCLLKLNSKSFKQEGQLCQPQGEASSRKRAKKKFQIKARLRLLSQKWLLMGLNTQLQQRAGNKNLC